MFYQTGRILRVEVHGTCSRERKREKEIEKTRSIVVHHVLLASSEFHAGARRYREPFILRNSFTSPAAGYRRRFLASLKFNDGAENIHSPRARGNKWFTLATSGRRRNDGRGGRWPGGRTRFKHIRERWCLKNNHAEGVEMEEARQKCEIEKVGAERERGREGGGSGSTTGAINSSGVVVVAIGLTVTTLVLQRGNGSRDGAAISREPRINYPHVKTYYRAHR